jgi:hypothetical protein
MKTKKVATAAATTTVVTPPVTTEAVTDNTATLNRLEAQFKQSLNEPAAIIAEIRARKLYEPKYASFSDYAAKRLKIQVPVVWNAVWAAAQKLNPPTPPTPAPEKKTPAKKTAQAKG